MNPLRASDFNILRPLVLPRPEASKSPGALLLSSMPGRYGPMSDFVADCKRVPVDVILCLVDDQEIGEKSPEYLAAIETGSVPFQIQRLPIPDYGLPPSPDAFVEELKPLWKKWAQGRSVVIHCAAGCGRTSLAAVTFLLLAKIPLEEALRQVQAAGSGPDTKEQRGFLDRTAGLLIDI